MSYPAKTFSAKDPSAILDYTINWATWLGTDTIATSSWTVTAGITKVSDSKTTTTTTIFVSGGTAGSNYDLTCTITTAGLRTDQRTIRVPVAER